MHQVVKEIEIPVFSLQIDLDECRFDSIEEIVAYFESEISAHKAAEFIATFDHRKHTAELPEGQLAEGIVAAYNLVFCFGFTLQTPDQLASRPRSIGICQMNDQIIVSFLEAPMPVANALMEVWAKSLLIENVSTAPHFKSVSAE
ncbi:MAG: hypothetical protein N0C81_09890 [Candidatus Thiodiazotropha lotti]|uniref:Uncharacterized protein n=1 Tax=Candidatus Thiodiazotropha lotti TaxID=2792787 RepID=A0A9E4K6H4_9GAMM|nr:hypothetical protein [Candidatus Thiodiazotropha lotti]ODC01487.1 hypothetical protein A3197_03150 [Candidatus Thiodiazotropha endoloripes]MCG7920620.1 hypothetical protein [Candidatus Thiodiazotropha lotti]MCG7930664.1 hypothetical protein [Candidatus Thiodiazotropha lotti]MCG7940059.1 hypothetical protein [Candidatus Thiodiazotropha lotti]